MAKPSSSAEAVQRRLAKRREEIGKSHSADWNKANPQKRQAQKAVERALIRGDLIRENCERCGTNVRVQAHHEDYTKALQVVWLCAFHHKQRHRELSCEAA